MEKKSFFEKIHNKGFTWHDNLLISSLLVWFLVLVGSVVGQLVILPFGKLIADEGFWSIFFMYFSTIGTWIFAVAYMAITKYNRPIFRALWKDAAGNNFRMLLIGLLAGFGMNAFCVLCAYLHKDIYIYFDHLDMIKFLALFAVVFIQSSSEELVCRAFHYQRLRKGYTNPLVAIIVNGVIFMTLHLFNDGMNAMSVINIVIIAVLYSFVIYYFDSIWFGMAAHAAWNFTQNILFGLPNSGIVSPYSVFKLDASTARSTWIYDVGFGVEGTVLANIVTVIAIVIVILLGRKYGRQELNVWEGFTYLTRKQKKEAEAQKAAVNDIDPDMTAETVADMDPDTTVETVTENKD